MMNQLQTIELEELETLDFNDEEQIVEVKERFKIDNLDSLNWAFRKLSALEAKKREINQLALAEMERIQAWEEAELKSIQGSHDFFQSLITEYHFNELEKDPKKKTIATPYGKAKSRLSKETPDKASEDKLLEHVKSAGMDEFIKESVKWGDLKKTLQIVEVDGNKVVVDENGQMVKGAVVKPESVKFSVEVE